MKETVKVHKIVRLGKTTDPNRPMKVTLDSAEQVVSVIKSAKKLSGKSDFKKITISMDRTPLEREMMRDLVRQKKENQAESDQKQEKALWVIRGDKVVNTLKAKPPLKPAAADGEETK
eukprot:TRINITY_DN4631_c0_g1_i3.p4 TRINITY_DN4631_c0_g1~~TRINITY_DN4631_c0_g1_i3.p4  ORF type:complete len:118 (+),score=27.59 TRINITY_DN4631_c0_g1_i3:713-1066(+)